MTTTETEFLDQYDPERYARPAVTVDLVLMSIVDGAPAHIAKQTKEFVASTEGRLSLYFLPPYSPQLNPDEWVWHNVKNTQIGRAVPMSQGHLRQLAEGALQRLKELPGTIRGFFRDPSLAYITA